MLTQLVQQLTRFLPQAAHKPVTPAALEAREERGWHESSWSLAQGVDVIELPAPAAASWFPDTQPSFHDASGGLPRGGMIVS
jgi:hypothetical protein